jgi:hypothetical protein
MKVHILQECLPLTYEKYKDNYTDKGLEYCYDTESLYYVAEIPFMPIEGQRLGTRFGLSIVDYAMYEIEEKGDYILNKTFITVRDE